MGALVTDNTRQDADASLPARGTHCGQRAAAAPLRCGAATNILSGAARARIARTPRCFLDLGRKLDGAVLQARAAVANSSGLNPEFIVIRAHKRPAIRRNGSFTSVLVQGHGRAGKVPYKKISIKQPYARHKLAALLSCPPNCLNFNEILKFVICLLHIPNTRCFAPAYVIAPV
jgi:hypothetical protein